MMTYVWMYERIDRRNGLDKFYQVFLGRETCDLDRPEIYQLGRIFTRKANAERYCKLANRQAVRLEVTK